jgi:hypothetical protein
LIVEINMRKSVYRFIIGMAVVFAAVLFAGCENVSNGGRRSGGSPGNGDPVSPGNSNPGSNEPGSGTPGSPGSPGAGGGEGGGTLTGDLDFMSETGRNITGTVQAGWDGTGADQTWTLSVVEEPTAVFAVTKAASQSITVTGTDAPKVTRVADGAKGGDGSVRVIDMSAGENHGKYTGDTTTYAGYTASSTLAVFSVDMSDLLFDGGFDGGTETRVFTLEVAEDGKDSRTYAVNLDITLDEGTQTSIYHRTGAPGAYRYEKVRDAALTDDDKLIVSRNNNNAFVAYDKGPVKDLQNAFVWVDHHGEGAGTWGSGTAPAGFASGTTAGYSEYRLFLKQDQQIERIVFSFLNSRATVQTGTIKDETDKRDHISIELYGAGVPGATEKKITRVSEPIQNTTTRALNSESGNASGKALITLFRSSSNNLYTDKYKALVLGKNITLTAPAGDTFVENSGNTLDNANVKMGITCLLYVDMNSTVIMGPHSKITGYNSTRDSSYVPVVLGPGRADLNSRFYVRGGTIDGNSTLNNIVFRILYHNVNEDDYIHVESGNVVGGTRKG